MKKLYIFCICQFWRPFCNIQSVYSSHQKIRYHKVSYRLQVHSSAYNILALFVFKFYHTLRGSKIFLKKLCPPFHNMLGFSVYIFFGAQNAGDRQIVAMNYLEMFQKMVVLLIILMSTHRY